MTRIVQFFLALVLAVGIPVTAWADTTTIDVSYDGVHYSSELPRPVLSGIERPVPGDHVAQRVWIRNSGTEPLEVTARLSATEPFADPVSGQWLTIGLDAHRSAISSLDAAPLRNPLGVLDAGEIRAIDLYLDLPFEAPNLTQDLQARLNLNLEVSGESSEVPPEHLPHTGTSALLLGTLSLALIFVATAILMRRRQEHGHDKD